MGRFFLTIVLGLALFGLIAWFFQWEIPSIVDDPKTALGQDQQTLKDLGNPLYAAEPFAELPPVPARPVDPISVAGHMTIIHKLQVSSQIDGKLLFIGEAVPEGTLAVAGVAPFVAQPFQFAKVDRGGQDLLKFYHRLEEGDTLREGQMVALLDPARALNEVLAKRSKAAATVAEHKAAIAKHGEAVAREETAQRLYIQKTISQQEFRAAQLTTISFYQEMMAKEAAVQLANIEVEMAETTLKQHYIHNEIWHGDSRVKTLLRRGGEAVKHMEPIMEIHNEDHLRAEGLLEVQYQNRVWPGMRVTMEPNYRDPPLRVLYAHRGEITSVAVSKDEANPFIISASKDRTVCIWDRKQAAPIDILYHPEAVLVAACPPSKAEANWFLSGSADGSIRLWNLDDLSKPIWTIDEAHQDGVTALAFSPDGRWFASGGADNNICMWDTKTGKKLYAFDTDSGIESPHQGTITALHFTPQGRLVSASRDNSLRVWKLYEKGPELENQPITGRSGAVSQLGVSSDGRWMLFDREKTLQILSVADGRTMSVLKKASGSAPFETLATFSPDGSLMLTSSAADGHLQLWKAPMPGVRGFASRQLSPVETASVTCAVFSPNAGRAAQPENSFAVSGTKDGHVYIWQVPSTAEVDSQRIPNLRLSMVERAIDAGAGQMRIGVEMRNLHGQQRLIPGLPVTMVIDPQQN